jgi:hypothetical protein
VIDVLFAFAALAKTGSVVRANFDGALALSSARILLARLVRPLPNAL